MSALDVLALLRHIADWVAVMYLGKVVEYGPAHQVFAPPFHPYTDALLAAAPEPTADAGPPRVVLGGTMPSRSEPIRGCVFASRCPRKMGVICDTVVPPVRQFGKHTFACHLGLGVHCPSRTGSPMALARPLHSALIFASLMIVVQRSTSVLRFASNDSAVLGLTGSTPMV